MNELLTNCLKAARILNLSCRDQTEAQSHELEGLLSGPERAAVGFHTLFCQGCRRNRRQYALLRDALRQSAAEVARPLDPERAERILRRIPQS